LRPEINSRKKTIGKDIDIECDGDKDVNVEYSNNIEYGDKDINAKCSDNTCNKNALLKLLLMSFIPISIEIRI